MKHLVLSFTVFFALQVSAAEPGVVPAAPDMKEEQETTDYSVGSTTRSELIYPSNYGISGIFRTRSAESLPDGTLTFGIGGEFYSVRNAPNVSGTGTNANSIAENLFVGYSPTERLTLGLFRRNSSTTYGAPSQLKSSLGDFNFSALYAFPILGQTLVLAPLIDLFFPSDFNNITGLNTFSAGGGLAATFSLYPTIGIPLFAHANVFYQMPTIRSSVALNTNTIAAETFYSYSSFSTINFLLGAEFKIGNFIPFAEYQHRFQLNAAIPIMTSPSRLTFGSRFTPIDNKSFSILLGADIGLAKGLVSGVPFNPDWQIIGQVSYTAAMSSMERKHYHTTADVKVVNRRFVISRNINFKVGRAELEEESKLILNQIVQLIKENGVKRLHIVGHTDSTATDELNLKLSYDRAETVKHYLGTQGIPQDGLTTQGFGKRKPKASNANESGRAINRRVEFFILD